MFQSVLCCPCRTSPSPRNPTRRPSLSTSERGTGACSRRSKWSWSIYESPDLIVFFLRDFIFKKTLFEKRHSWVLLYGNFFPSLLYRVHLYATCDINRIYISSRLTSEPFVFFITVDY